MTSRQMVASEAALIPLLMGKQSCNITFVLDSSESMRAVLGSVKRLLIQTLLTKASLRDSLFNIVTFSNKVTCWSQHMVPCAPDTVYTALSWIHSITCSFGRDLLAALSLALTDSACHAVHLLITDLPDQPEAVLRALPALAAGSPVNIFYLQDSVAQLDSNIRNYLHCLTQATRGSCYMITDNSNGKLGKVIPLYVAENQSSVPAVSPVNHCCLSTSSPLLRCSLGNNLRPFTSCVMSGRTLGGSEFLPGCRVLARREVDGLYYLGTVIQQVQDRTGVWVVEFDHPGGAIFGAVSSQRQLVCSLDMVNRIRDHTCCLVPGDAVLSPWEQDLRRYGPGRVMATTGHRDADGVTGLRVLMWNGCVSLVPDSLVLPISASHYDRIVRELQIPTSASCQGCRWVCGRSSSWTPQLFCTDCSASASCCCSVTNHWPCLHPPSCRSSLGRMDGFEGAERDKQVDLKDSDHEVPSSSSSSVSEDETRASFPSAVKLRSKQQRPPWRYWRRTGPEPQHRQPGSAVARRTSQPVRFSFPVPQISASPNRSSLFQVLPGAKGRKASVRDVFETTKFKPRPPEGLQPFSGNSATTVYT
ncbi:uncharacterized protein C11orf16 homolog [Toxotes jaculatrix]|uniref:uncharacterized protein C11orf16 homolog n=1 Tax=Toxotes jaculatrix TaxID=941984 RepID=UPI001B3AF4A5|nr:uncharacterized protein C11orf16 homolog [Toxotes jaculatrix]